MSFRDDILDDLDDIRAIPGEMGLHRFRVFVRVQVYSGGTVGRSAPTTTETELLVGGQPPHVREIRSKDVVAGDAALKSTMYEIGPLTPELTDADTLDPPGTAGVRATTTYRITGQGLPTDGVLCQRVEDDTWQPMTYKIRVRTIGRRGAAP